MKKEKIILNIASLFAGVGGICKGFLEVNNDNVEYKIAWANEIDKSACITYRHNFNHTILEGDLYKVLDPTLEEDLELRATYENAHNIVKNSKIDVLNGGFPCQSFSVSGARKGFEDKRGLLFFAIVDTIKLLGENKGKPRFLLLENVKNLVGHDNGNTFKRVREELIDLGYIVKSKVLNTKTYTDIPQNRERIFIVGFLNKSDADKFTLFDGDEASLFSKGELEKYKSKTFTKNDKRVFDILDTEVDEKYYYTKEKYPNLFNEVTNLSKGITEKGQFYLLRYSKNLRKNQSNVCPAIMAAGGMGGHNVPLIIDDKGVRKLTTKEVFKLQGFPIGNGYELPNIADGQLYKQAGNSVTVPIITIIAKYLAKCVEPK